MGAGGDGGHDVSSLSRMVSRDARRASIDEKPKQANGGYGSALRRISADPKRVLTCTSQFQPDPDLTPGSKEWALHEPATEVRQSHPAGVAVHIDAVIRLQKNICVTTMSSPGARVHTVAFKLCTNLKVI